MSKHKAKEQDSSQQIIETKKKPQYKNYNTIERQTIKTTQMLIKTVNMVQ